MSQKRKNKKRKPARSERKKRNEYIYGTTVGEVTEISLTVDSRTGAIRFGNEMTNVYSEVNYDRPKGPKVLSRVPQKNGEISFDAAPALSANFDFLCAVDTNTRQLNGKILSIVGVVTLKSSGVPTPQGLRQHWIFGVPFCLAYLEIRSKPENFGWLMALMHLRERKHTTDSQRVGVIVDSDLGNLSDYNQRKTPIDESIYLPRNVQLIYATSDAGMESILNKALSIADSAATQCLNAFESMPVQFNHPPAGIKSYEGFKLIIPDVVRG